MDNKHNLVAYVCDKLLESEVAQRDNFQDVFFSKPYNIVITSHCCLLCHHHGAAVSLQSHFSLEPGGFLH